MRTSVDGEKPQLQSLVERMPDVALVHISPPINK